jgi:hypothetical protein
LNNYLKGFRTVIALAVSAYLVPLAAHYGFNLSADEQAQLVGYGMAGLAIIFKLLQHHPALNKDQPK